MECLFRLIGTDSRFSGSHGTYMCSHFAHTEVRDLDEVELRWM